MKDFDEFLATKPFEDLYGKAYSKVLREVVPSSFHDENDRKLISCLKVYTEFMLTETLKRYHKWLQESEESE